MDREALIRLDLDQQVDCVLVSSPQFPLLHLAIADGSDAEITAHVLPVLKEMIEARVTETVALRLVSPFEDEKPAAVRSETPPPHVIAVMQAAHVG